MTAWMCPSSGRTSSMLSGARCAALLRRLPPGMPSPLCSAGSGSPHDDDASSEDRATSLTLVSVEGAERMGGVLAAGAA